MKVDGCWKTMKIKGEVNTFDNHLAIERESIQLGTNEKGEYRDVANLNKEEN